ncbi:uncharacterized protein [Spinacia oleracea]|uniref:KIB1-4 beta-propeller domain-containing protein n=1 Tax=Spinacia oleracea TaxID=3562 RepID=A0ABM3RRL6_SPIOL|nr:uncharacterized protein LOC130471917 [Spinacia oleracea]
MSNKKVKKYEEDPIPIEIKAKIIEPFDQYLDILRLRAVSTSFRSLIPLPSKPYSGDVFLDVPPLFFDDSNSDSGSDSDSDSYSYTSQLNRKILYLITNHNNNNKYIIHVKQTANTSRFKTLPLFEFDDGGKVSKINLLDHKVMEIFRFYDFGYKTSGLNFKRMVSNLHPTTSKLIFLGLFNGKLFWWRYVGDNWNPISISLPRKSNSTTLFVDVINYKGQFLALNCDKRLIKIIIRITSLEKSQGVVFHQEIVSEQSRYNEAYMKSHLVECDGDLYLVMVYAKKERKLSCYNNGEVEEPKDVGNKLKVFQLDQKEGNYYWRKVNKLGGKVFFLWERASFAISEKDVGSSKGDLIFWNRNRYNLEDNTFQRFEQKYHGRKRNKSKVRGGNLFTWPM